MLKRLGAPGGEHTARQVTLHMPDRLEIPASGASCSEPRLPPRPTSSTPTPPHGKSQRVRLPSTACLGPPELPWLPVSRRSGWGAPAPPVPPFLDLAPVTCPGWAVPVGMPAALAARSPLACVLRGARAQGAAAFSRGPPGRKPRAAFGSTVEARYRFVNEWMSHTRSQDCG